MCETFYLELTFLSRGIVALWLFQLFGVIVRDYNGSIEGWALPDLIHAHLKNTLVIPRSREVYSR